MGDVVEPQPFEGLRLPPHDPGEGAVDPDEAALEVDVGDPDGGALEHRAELVVLLLPQRLEAAAGGDVGHEGEHQQVAVVADEHAHELVDPRRRAVGPQVAVLDLEELVLTGEQAFERVEVLGAVVRVHEAGELHPGEVLLGPSDQACVRRVAAHDATFPVRDRHALGGVVEHGPEPRLGRGDGQRLVVVGPCPGRRHHRRQGRAGQRRRRYPAASGVSSDVGRVQRRRSTPGAPRAGPRPGSRHGWSWRESNPRPRSGDRTRYDHSRAMWLTGATLPGQLGLRPPPGLSPGSSVFPDVSGLSLRSSTASVAGLQRTGPACPHGSR